MDKKFSFWERHIRSIDPRMAPVIVQQGENNIKSHDLSLCIGLVMDDSVSVGRVMEALRGCYDPEIPVNIVDLGLVYNVTILDEGKVHVRYTLTARGCPAHEYLSQQVKEAVQKLPGVKNVEIEVVWDPPWTPERMSEAARKQLQKIQDDGSPILDFDASTFKPFKKGHLVKNPDGTMILINLANGRFLVNEDIANLWERSDAQRTVDEITSLIALDLQLSPVEVRPQIIELYRSLIAAGLIESAKKNEHLLPLGT